MKLKEGKVGYTGVCSDLGSGLVIRLLQVSLSGSMKEEDRVG